MNPQRILIIEDEASIAENLIYALKTEGFDCRRVSTAAEGLRVFSEEPGWDLLILDVGLPDLSGFEVCKRVRSTSAVPIFFLTARSEEIDRILGLELGGDDYITKPFSPREVTARVKALFRRIAVPHASSAGPSPGFQVLEDRYQILYEGKDLGLRKYEFALLKFLLENPGRVYSRTQLMEKLWQDPDMSMERTVDTHIKVIRSKIRAHSEVEWIQTHRGLGYSFREK